MNDLFAKSKEIDSLVKKKYPWDDENEIGPIYDGIIDIKKYLNSKYKILWILKEPYDEIDENGKPYGGGWDLKEVMANKKSISDFGREIRTFQPIIYSSYGILNNYITWEDMPSSTEQDVFDTIKRISYINVKKIPGNTSSPPSIIAEAYENNKSILLKQIETYNPDVVIGGNTLHLFLNDLCASKEELIVREEGSFPYLGKANRLYIFAYHPASVPRIVNESDYCNDIIFTVKSICG